MAAPRTRLTQLLGLGTLALALPACSVPTYTAQQESNLPAPVIVSTSAAPRGVRPPPEVHEPPIRQARAEEPAPDALPRQQFSAAPDLMTDSQAAAPADFWDRLDRDIDLSLQDYRHYYSLPNLALFALGIGAAAPIANTSADRHIRHWIQTRGHAHAESLAELFNYGGQLWVIVPAGLEIAALCGKAPEDYASDGGWFEWSNRSLRAIAVGFPPVVACYALLGSARPDLSNDSRWHPFEHFHGMSGHTFIGAVPFLTAASMTDNPWVKYPLVFGSFLTGWARLYEDRHYFSQVALGWWCAFLAVHSVNQTENERRSLSVVPMVMPGGAGMGVELRY
jgi:hypothetical protein